MIFPVPPLAWKLGAFLVALTLSFYAGMSFEGNRRDAEMLRQERQITALREQNRFLTQQYETRRLAQEREFSQKLQEALDAIEDEHDLGDCELWDADRMRRLFGNP